MCIYIYIERERLAPVSTCKTSRRGSRNPQIVADASYYSRVCYVVVCYVMYNTIGEFMLLHNILLNYKNNII